MAGRRDQLIRLERVLWDVIMGFSHRDIAAHVASQAQLTLPPASWSLLEHLKANGPMRVSEIAACHGVDTSSVTPRLQALERDGLVVRSGDPDDRRASVIAIGPEGRLALDRIHAARSDILAAALSETEEGDVTTASRLLARIASRLVKQPEQTDHTRPGIRRIEESSMPNSFFDIPLTRIDGSPASLAEHAGKALLIVNVASKCGLTPQYDGLESLYRTYRDRGLVVLGFPANDFKGQEPGSEAEIEEFCRSTYGVDFPMYAKITVTGPGKHPLYRTLIEARPVAEFKPDSMFLKRPPQAGNEAEVHWNFEKFLVDRNGAVVGRFAPDTVPEDAAIVAAIEAVLPV